MWEAVNHYMNCGNRPLNFVGGKDSDYDYDEKYRIEDPKKNY